MEYTELMPRYPRRGLEGSAMRIADRSRLMTWAFVLGLGLAASDPAGAANPGACTRPEFRQFDFRLGSYSVTTRTGQPAGVALIESVLDGCMLMEHWTGAISGHGRAHYFYDVNDDVWRLLFVNDQGGRLIMAGRLVDGAMVFSGPNRFNEFDGLHRMTWSRLSDGRVSQHWELSIDEGASWKDVFLGVYARRNDAPR